MHKSHQRRLINVSLSSLRQGTFLAEDALRRIQQCIADTGLTLQQIGTSEDELEACRRQGCKLHAEHWLAFLRRGTLMHETAMLILLGYVARGELTLAEIGTTQEELSQLGNPTAQARQQLLHDATGFNRKRAA